MWFMLSHRSFRPSRRQNNNLPRFVVQKEHAFIRNIFHQHELKQSIPISTIENYYKSFRKVLQWSLCYRQAILVKVIQRINQMTVSQNLSKIKTLKTSLNFSLKQRIRKSKTQTESIDVTSNFSKLLHLSNLKLCTFY